MENIIVVGTGDLYQRFLTPCLEYMQHKNVINLIATVSLNDNKFLLNQTEHRVRNQNQKLSELISDLKLKNPIVFVGHSNENHLSDAKDLVENGFRVMLEKPYTINKEELKTLRDIVGQNPGKIVLLDYYIKRKVAPLNFLAGALNENSFYFESEEVFRKKEFEDISELHGKIKDFIGEPLSVAIHILEGGSDSGSLSNRGSFFFDTRRGGGMILDLGFHAVASLFSLKDFFGEIDTNFNGKVKIAQEKGYLHKAINDHNIKEKDVAETYAEFNFSTSKNVPIEIFVGKYVPDLPDQKKILIKGTKGEICMDMYENELIIKNNFGENYSKKIELINSKNLRYYPVILAGIEYLNEKNVFKFDLNSVLLEAHEFILNVIEKARSLNAVKIYDSSTPYYEIFRERSIKMGNLDNFDKRNLNIYFSEYTNHLYKIIKEIDTKDLDLIVMALLKARLGGNTIFFVGNGGSATTASHFSQDILDIGRKLKSSIFKTISLSDNVSMITATANDYGYDHVFSFQMERIFQKGDILFAISASGNSPNILEAVKLAKSRGGIVVGLVGFDGGKLLPLCDYVIHAKTEKGEYGPVEDIHVIFDHVLTTYLHYKLKREVENE